MIPLYQVLTPPDKNGKRERWPKDRTFDDPEYALTCAIYPGASFEVNVNKSDEARRLGYEAIEVEIVPVAEINRLRDGYAQLERDYAAISQGGQYAIVPVSELEELRRATHRLGQSRSNEIEATGE